MSFKHLLQGFACILLSQTLLAQGNNIVTLTTSGTAATKNEAVLTALRSAIEQTYGVFVSAETQILNDCLIKDDIVSVSRGNVSSYKVLSEIQLPSGEFSVTLNATVSINNLISYAKSIGSKAEFAGSTFAMNTKLVKLKAANSKKAYEMMCNQVMLLLDNAFDYSISLGEPSAKEAGDVYYKDRYNWINNLRYGEEYIVPVRITVLVNEVNYQIRKLVYETVKSLSIPGSERETYESILGFNNLVYFHGASLKNGNNLHLTPGKNIKDLSFLPFSIHDLFALDKPVLDKIALSWYNYTIYDNQSTFWWNQSYPSNLAWERDLLREHDDYGSHYYLIQKYRSLPVPKKTLYYLGDSLDSFTLYEYSISGYYSRQNYCYQHTAGRSLWEEAVFSWLENGKTIMTISFSLHFFSLDDISSYTGLEIKRGNEIKQTEVSYKVD